MKTSYLESKIIAHEMVKHRPERFFENWPAYYNIKRGKELEEIPPMNLLYRCTGGCEISDKVYHWKYDGELHKYVKVFEEVPCTELLVPVDYLVRLRVQIDILLNGFVGEYDISTLTMPCGCCDRTMYRSYLKNYDEQLKMLLKVHGKTQKTRERTFIMSGLPWTGYRYTRSTEKWKRFFSCDDMLYGFERLNDASPIYDWDIWEYGKDYEINSDYVEPNCEQRINERISHEREINSLWCDFIYKLRRAIAKEGLYDSSATGWWNAAF